MNRTGFQTFVNDNLPIAVAGDFASANPTASVLGGPGAYVAPAAGTNVGVFAWFDPTTGFASNYYKPGALLGFVHRENQGLITTFLGISTTLVASGHTVNGLAQGDFYGIFASGATPGQKVYANPVTGALTSAATGGSVTGSYTTAAVSSSVLTTTDANLTGTAAAVGQLVTGGTLPEGTYISAANGTGSGTHLWILSNVNGTAIPDNASFTSTEYGIRETPWTVIDTVKANATSSASSIAATGILTIGGSLVGTFEVGQFVSGGTIPATVNVQILSQLTGTAGGAGTYQTNYNAVVTSFALTAHQGQIGAISSWL